VGKKEARFFTASNLFGTLPESSKCNREGRWVISERHIASKRNREKYAREKRQIKIKNTNKNQTRDHRTDSL